MISSPVRCASPASATQQAHTHTRHGGNLARFLTWAGHFLFTPQTPHDLGADGPNLNEAGIASLPARGGAGAAFNRHGLSAKSRPLQSLDLVHLSLPCCLRKYTSKARALGGKAVHV